MDQVVDILLVEDNPEDVELALRALRRGRVGNAVHVARDGAEALDYFFGTAPDGHPAGFSRTRLVLLDLKLPKIDGLEVLQRLKEDARTRHIPVVVMTSSREERDIARSYALNANSYIVKPVDFEQFNESILEVGFYWLLLNQSPHG